MTETRFETCDHCNGYGNEVFRVTVYEHGCGFPHDDSAERTCPECGGTGQREYEVEPITADDLEECPECKGSGFNGYGSGYGDVCGNCGGLKYLTLMPRQETP